MNRPNEITNSNASWEQNTLEKLLLEVYREQHRIRIWNRVKKLCFLIIFLILIILLFSGKDNEYTAEPHTAVINLTGTIDNENNQAGVLQEGMEAAYKNKQVKGIIIRANSPGGSPVMANIAYEQIRYLKAKHPQMPIYVVAEDLCASGCYYIASAADKIYADPSSLVGSIGVIGSSFDFTGLMDKLGIKRRVKIAGDNKSMGDPFIPETTEQARIWQQMLTSIHQQFINAVKQGRGERLKFANNPDIFSGRAYTGDEAKAIGLIDDFGNIYSVSRQNIGAPKLVDYTPSISLSKRISRRIGSEIQQSLQSMIQQSGW